MTPDPKQKTTRLRGSRLKRLYEQVQLRDEYLCQICHTWTEAPPHHIKSRGSGGSDTEDNLILLCMGCHDGVHRGAIHLN